MTTRTISLTEYESLVNTELGVSEWICVDQSRIDQFAVVTGDRHFIHTDPARAAQSRLGGTIAHGFLALSLLSAMGHDVLPRIEGTSVVLNYGLNRVRFLSPLRSGKRIRGRFLLANVEVDEGRKSFKSTLIATVEIEAEPKPALVAEWLAMTYCDDA